MIRSRNNSLGALGMALFALIALLPIGFSLGYAGAYSVGLAGLLSEGFTLEHWARLFSDGEVWRAFGLSLYVAAVTVALSVGLALALLLFLRRPLKEGPLSYVVYFPLAIPATVAAFLVFQLFSGAGYVARWLLHLGVIDDVAQMPNLVNDPYAFGIILAHVSLATPFFILLFAQLYETEKIEALTETARTLGANRRACLYRISVPILLTQSFTNVILLFIFVFGSYEIPLLLGRQSPQMVSVLTMRKYALFDITQKPEAFIVALLYTALVLALIGWAFRSGRAGGRA
ncbi:ABC transporter permease subunit [Rhodocaloribacter sp.]